MGQENYAETLKRLLTFTQAKFVSIAEVVGYDISYVNKWSNGTKLPSSRYIEQINEDLGRYFTRLIKENNREKRFIKTFSLPEDTTDLEFAITQHSPNTSDKNKRRKASCLITSINGDT